MNGVKSDDALFKLVGIYSGSTFYQTLTFNGLLHLSKILKRCVTCVICK